MYSDYIKNIIYIIVCLYLLKITNNKYNIIINYLIRNNKLTTSQQ